MPGRGWACSASHPADTGAVGRSSSSIPQATGGNDSNSDDDADGSDDLDDSEPRDETSSPHGLRPSIPGSSRLDISMLPEIHHTDVDMTGQSFSRRTPGTPSAEVTPLGDDNFDEESLSGGEPNSVSQSIPESSIGELLQELRETRRDIQKWTTKVDQATRMLEKLEDRLQAKEKDIEELIAQSSLRSNNTHAAANPNALVVQDELKLQREAFLQARYLQAQQQTRTTSVLRDTPYFSHD